MPTEGLLLVARQSQPKQPAMVLLPEPNALWLRCLQHPNHWYVAVPPCDADTYLTFISLSLTLMLALGFNAMLSLLPGNTSSVYGSDISPLVMNVEMQTSSRLRVRITDANNARWEVPSSVLPRPPVSSAATNPNYKFTYTQSPFGFAVTRVSDGMPTNTTRRITERLQVAERER
jgi:hypothetical protein